MIRTYQCANTSCSNFAQPLHIRPRLLDGDYWEWPNVVCVCNQEPRIVAIDGVRIVD